MARGMHVFAWTVGLALTSAGCVEKPFGGVASTSSPPARAAVEREVGQSNQTAPVRVASLVQTPLPQDNRSPDLPPPPPPAKPQSASEPPPPDAAAPPSAPALEAPGSDSATNLHRLLKLAESECATLDSYICRMTRREQVNGSAKPEEMMLFKFRKQPFSIYFKWIGNENKGREVVYVKGKFDDKLHILMSPGGTVMSLAPDSFLIRRSSRHPVTEAGVVSILEKYAAAVGSFDRGQHPLRYLGPCKRPDFDEGTTLEGVEEDLAPGADPILPRGGRRQLYFHVTNHFPVLVVTRDDRGQEVEYYRFDRLQLRVKLDDDDFNPSKLFGKR